MKRLLTVLLALVCLAALPLSAGAAAKPDSKELAQRIKAAGAYWQLTNTHERIIETLEKVSAQLPQDKRKGFLDRANKYFGKTRMAGIKKQWLVMAAQVFTADELKALVAFYSSKQGMAIRDKMPELLQGNAKIVGAEMTAFIQTERERMAKEAAAAAKTAPAPAPAKKQDKK
ncbi:MAG: DUF2059 domain-containing protein [Desulfarculaceae bacterium]|nr:DUF2059 domain-containing protein [Desulfarculaceae bacterium]MCF8071884.1 DUF2059 domain-containing protein [Desulfarculaceae bacterium]MCF8101434.1 DUF2059 domain-containing protein [Desulfarculaceae bacterium]MCF8118196.1 DUF2059 domain-containing protein [Desulfarculaceae bacterium]